jgi:hypothetical protein
MISKRSAGQQRLPDQYTIKASRWAPTFRLLSSGRGDKPGKREIGMSGSELFDTCLAGDSPCASEDPVLA